LSEPANAHLESRPILGGILIGGRSVRMGRPKHLFRWNGRSFLEHVVEAMRPHAQEIVLLGEGEIPPECAGLARLSDAAGAEGPIAGILSALRSNPEAAWVIAPCDLPLLTARAVGWLLEERSPERWVVLPVNAAGRAEPLAAVYEPEAAALVERAIRSGRSAPRVLAEDRRVHTPLIPPKLARAFRDIDTPEDLAALG